MTLPARATSTAIAKAGARLKSLQRDLFTSNLHDERNAALLGSALGISFTVCFVTGLYSHFAQHPPTWFLLPSRPAGLYRVTQGLHVATGLASIPLLLAKLWTVYPKLFTWPPFSSIANAVERLTIFPLVAGSLFLLFTGLANINLWYPWKFNFPIAHYWAAWTTIGALVAHIGAKWTITRRHLRPTRAARAAASPAPAVTGEAANLERRRFLAAVFGTSAVVTLFTIGQTVRPLRKLALLAPRRPDSGTQGFPVNRTARAAGVAESANSPDYRLLVTGNVRRQLTLALDDVRALPQRTATLPIACVEGWSTSQRWSGVPVRDLLVMAGARPDATVHVRSLQRARSYRTSELDHWQAHDPDTLLALRVNGEELALDHGYPLRLIAPDRPGVMQTKWVTQLVVR
jgi:DMSO/TMAO reductase YedYZ molybdopterin-dependent catalytic subunit